MPARFITMKQVAEELSLSEAQVYALVRSKDLPAVKIGGRGFADRRRTRCRVDGQRRGIYSSSGRMRSRTANRLAAATRSTGHRAAFSDQLTVVGESVDV
jgi:excisionase family DNA binding protein